jgi:hypothetical protein
MYKPRTQSKKFLDGDCPSGVLAIYDSGAKTFDRYTVFYKPTEPVDYAYGYIGYRGMSEHPYAPNGFGIYGEMKAHEVASYRNRVYRDSCKWSDLPEDVQRSVRADCADFQAGE